MAFNPPPFDFPQRGAPFLQSTLPHQTKPAEASAALLVIAGLSAIASGALGAASWLIEDGNQSGYDKVSIVIASVCAILGGIMAVTQKQTGAAIGLGGAAFFSNIAISLLGLTADFDGTLDSKGSKLLVAAGAVGLFAIGAGLAAQRGRANKGLGAIVAILAFVPAVAIAAIIHLDDARETFQLGIVGGYVLVGLVVLIGAFRGEWGVLASLTVALAHLPIWIELAKDADDRQFAAIGGTVAFAAIAVFAMMASLASTSAEPSAAAGSGSSPGQTPSWITQPAGSPSVGSNPAAASFGQATGSRPQAGQVPPPQAPGQAPGFAGQPSPTAARPATVIAGQWAADPYGRFQNRYWNGTQWTEHVSSNGVNSIDPI